MRLTVAAVPIEIAAFDLQIRAPGIIRFVAFEEVKELVMTAGRPEFRERPVIFIESSPGGPIINRKFICIKHGDILEEAEDEKATWAGTGVSGRGNIVHVYELKKLS